MHVIAEGEDVSVFSEAFLYDRMMKDDARFILHVADEYTRLIEVLGKERVIDLLVGTKEGTNAQPLPWKQAAKRLFREVAGLLAQVEGARHRWEQEAEKIQSVQCPLCQEQMGEYPEFPFYHCIRCDEAFELRPVALVDDDE